MLREVLLHHLRVRIQPHFMTLDTGNPGGICWLLTQALFPLHSQMLYCIKINKQNVKLCATLLSPCQSVCWKTTGRQCDAREGATGSGMHPPSARTAVQPHKIRTTT